MFLFTSSRNGVSAKEVQRLTGVTYKTAWRMCNEIRKYMGWVDGDAPLGGSGPKAKPVEMDKAFIGGRDKMGFDDKAVVLGMIERDGSVMAKVIPGMLKSRDLEVVAIASRNLKRAKEAGTSVPAHVRANFERLARYVSTAPGPWDGGSGSTGGLATA